MPVRTPLSRGETLNPLSAPPTSVGGAFFMRRDQSIRRVERTSEVAATSVTGLRDAGVAFRSLTEGMDTTTPHGELLFHIFGALAQYERALTRERVQAGLAAARRRGRRGGRPTAIEPEKLEAVFAALEGGTSKAAVCRTFGIARSTLIDTLARAGWTGAGSTS